MIIPSANVFRRMLNLYLAGTRGGPMRLQIIVLLMKMPMNINELSKNLGLDYKTAQYHVRILKKSGFIKSSGKKYSDAYEISEMLKVHKDVIMDISRDMGKS